MQNDQLSDANILELISSDRRNFTHIYNKYYNAIYRYAYIRLNYTRELAEDITANTFVNAYKAIHNVVLDPQRQTILPWLFTIARNEINKEYKKNKNKIELDKEILDIIPSKTNEESINNTQLDAEIILKEIAKLKPETQEIVYLKIYQDYTFIEIANMLKITESKAKMQYYRAIEYVTKILNK